MKKYPLILLFTVNLIYNFPTHAATTNSTRSPVIPYNTDSNTSITFQVEVIKKVVQDKINARLYIQKYASRVETVQSEINSSMHDALNISKKYLQINASTTNYSVYFDEQKGLWKAQESIQLNSESATQMASLLGELQRKGFAVETYNYYVSQEKKSSFEDELRAEVLRKATHIATNVLAKNINQKFVRFVTIDFTMQNYLYPSNNSSYLKTANINLSANSNLPTAQSGTSDIQMTANITAIFDTK